jgi:hypothetical protein
MSGLSNTTKQYWIEEIKKELQRRAEEILKGSGRPNYLADLKEVARQKILKDKGVLDVYDQHLELQAQHDRLEGEMDKLRKQLEAALEAHGMYGYRSVGSQLDRLAEEELPTLMARDELGEQLLALKEQEANIERTIMLATTEARLRDWLVSYFAGLGVELEV